MNRAEKIASEARDRVKSWASLSPEDRKALLSERPVTIKTLDSGGAMLSVNGVDRFCASYRHAEAEAKALTQS